MSELRKRVLPERIAFHKRTIAEAIVMEKGRRTEVAVCGQKKTDMVGQKTPRDSRDPSVASLSSPR